MKYIVVGLNHKTAPVGVREKVALDTQKSIQVLGQILKFPFISEATVVSTCNRVEFYGTTKNVGDAQLALARVFGDVHAGKDAELDVHLYSKTDHEAVSHLFSVVTSLDSMITGENQILGQVKTAYELALEQEATGAYLNKLFHRAFYVAKRVRSETGLGEGSVSVGSAAVMLAEKIFSSLVNKSVLLLGTGEIGELVVRHLHAQKVGKVFIANRTFQKAEEMQDLGLGQALEYGKIPDALPEVDILITSLSHVLNELDRDFFASLMQKRKNQPLFVIDLGVPRNISADVAGIHNLYVYNIDDLQIISEQGKKNREKHVDQAQAIIDEEVKIFYEKCIGDEALPTIAGLGQKFELVRQKELQRALSRMPDLSGDHVKTIDKLTQSLINRLLHEPILSLKNEKEMTEPAVLRLIQRIFRLNDEE